MGTRWGLGSQCHWHCEPNVFTPNLTTNNRFFIVTRGVLSGQLIIFDRQGVEMFRTDSLDESWDGTSHGKLCPQGNYVYRFTYTPADMPNSRKTFVGTVLLVR